MTGTRPGKLRTSRAAARSTDWTNSLYKSGDRNALCLLFNKLLCSHTLFCTLCLKKHVTTYSKITWSRTVSLQVFSVSRLTYLVQLLYPGKLSRPKYHEFNLKLLTFPMLQYYNINCKTVSILFYLLIIQLTVYE